MRTHQRRLVPLAILFLLSAACDDGTSPRDRTDATSGSGDFDTSLVGDGDSTTDAPDTAPRTCAPNARWTGGGSPFTEITDAAGLRALGVQGTRLSVLDLDGDGFPDLLVRRGGARADVLEPGEEARHTWLLRNLGDGTFEDVTLASGLLTPRGTWPIAIGRPFETVAAADIDHDGDIDLYTGLDTRAPVTIARPPDGPDGDLLVTETSEVLLNDGTGRFTLAPADSDLRRAGVLDIPSGAAFLHADDDGIPDLFVSQGGLGQPLQDRVYRGRGDGTFEDMTDAWGLATLPWNELDDVNGGRAHSTAWSAAACDLDDDGRPELLAGAYGRAPNLLWDSAPANEAPAWNNRSVASGFASDTDTTWQDNQFARCYCAANRSADGCAGVPSPLITCSQANWRHDLDREPYRSGGNTGTVLCADLDNDGRTDLVTTEIRHWWAGPGSDTSQILRNTGEDPLRLERLDPDTTGVRFPQPGPSWDEGIITGGAFDFDNDGAIDLLLNGTDYPGNRAFLLHSDGGSPPRYTLLDAAGSIDHNRAHGIALADFDRDGDIDVVLGHSRARCDANAPNDCYPDAQVRMFRNDRGHTGNWLQVEVTRPATTAGAPPIRSLPGARVEVRSPATGTQLRDQDGGHGHFGIQHDTLLSFGLGPDCEADVRVRLPGDFAWSPSARLHAGRWRFTPPDTWDLLD